MRNFKPETHYCIQFYQLAYIHRVADMDRRDGLLADQAAHALLGPAGGTRPELVVALFRDTFVRRLVVAQHVCPGLGDNAHVDVGPRAEIVEDTSLDGGGHDGDTLLASHVGPPARLKDSHSGERSRAHGDVGKLVGAAVRVDGEELWAGGVDTCENQCGTYMALIAT